MELLKSKVRNIKHCGSPQRNTHQSNISFLTWLELPTYVWIKPLENSASNLWPVQKDTMIDSIKYYWEANYTQFISKVINAVKCLGLNPK